MSPAHSQGLIKIVEAQIRQIEAERDAGILPVRECDFVEIAVESYEVDFEDRFTANMLSPFGRSRMGFGA